jgi:5'-3' exonuclease
MNRLELVDIVSTDDSDAFVFGAKTIVRNIGWRKREGRNDLKMSIYDIDGIIKVYFFFFFKID